MKERLQVLFRNKAFIFCLPLLIFILIFGGEYLLDIIIGDGDGNITIPLFIMLKPIIKLVLFIYFIYNIFTILLKMSVGQFIFNFGFVILVIYSIEFYLKKKDPFLKGPFDSGYYNNNIAKYRNVLKAPKDYVEKYITWGKSTKKNKYSFRDDEITYPKPKQTFRIMVLGDSFTWGAGLSESEMYTNKLDSMLKKHFPDNKIEVLNCALAGSPTIKERDILRHLKDTVQPDLILVGFCSNDPQPKGEDYSWEKEKFDLKWGKTLLYFQNAFNYIKLNYVGELFVGFVYSFQEKTGSIPVFTEALGRVYKKESKEWKAFEKALQDIRNMSDSLNCCANPVAGVFTQFGSFDSGEKMSEEDVKSMKVSRTWINQAADAFVSHGFNSVNFIPVFEKLIVENKIKASNLKVNVLDGHPSAAMNRVFADKLFKTIVPVISSRMDSLKLAK